MAQVHSELEDGVQPIRVLLIAPSMAIVGGHSIQAAKLFSVLDGLPELQMTFFPLDPTPPRVLAWARRIPVVRTLLMFCLFVFGLLRVVPRCDVLHVFTAGLSSYTLWTIPALLISRFLGKRFLMHYHDGQAEQHLTEWRSAKPTIALADRLIVPSGFLVEVFAKHGIVAESVPNLVELDRFRFRARSKLRPVFMTNRMLEPHYNIPCILRAFAIIQQSVLEASLTIAHDGHSRQMLESLARDLGLRNVSFIGRVAYDDVPALYEAADIYVMTPDIDNMPGSLLECFASGVPVIATNAGGIPYISKDRETALLVEINDHEAVAARALELLDSPDLVRYLTEQGAHEVQKYHWRPLRDQWLSIYQMMAANAGQ